MNGLDEEVRCGSKGNSGKVGRSKWGSETSSGKKVNSGKVVRSEWGSGGVKGVSRRAVRRN